jgi:hypothetical protein
MQAAPRRSALRTLLAIPLGLAAAAGVAPARAASGSTQKQLDALTDRQDVTEARQQITDVLFRYARGWDRLDEDALRSCFHSDSTHQHGAFKGLSADFITGGLKIVRTLKSCTHMITNVSIDVVGTKAVSECYFLSHHRRNKKTGPGEEDWFLKGRYLDRFEQRAGAWKIAHRRGLHDFSRTFDPADTSLDAAPVEQLSLHSTQDPLYAMLAELHPAGQ